MLNVSVYMDGDEVCALLGDPYEMNQAETPAGFGKSVADALRELADNCEEENIGLN